MKILASVALVSCMVFGAAATAVAGIEIVEWSIPWVAEGGEAPPVPQIFRADRAARLAAEEAAREDAYRKLIERIHGLSIDGTTIVQDLVMRSRVIDAALRNELKGMRDVQKRYADDGRVEIAVQVTVREVVEVIRKNYERIEKDARIVKEETITNIERINRDKEIAVVGRGALPGTLGLRRIQALRAAEADCYVRIAARAFGIKVNADTTVREFTLSSDHIRSRVCHTLLNGVRFTRYEILDDDTVRVTGQLTMNEVIETLTRTYTREVHGRNIKIEDIKNVEREQRDTVIEEAGVAVVLPPGEESEPIVVERTTIVERVLSKEIVVE